MQIFFAMARGDPIKSQLIEEVMLDLRRVERAIEADSSALEARLGITAPQLWALWFLDRCGAMTLKDLASSLYLHPSTLVGVIDRLEAKGLAERRQDPADRRRLSLVITPRGRRLVRGTEQPGPGGLLRGLKRLRTTALEELRSSLGQLVGMMEDPAPRTP